MIIFLSFLETQQRFVFVMCYGEILLCTNFCDEKAVFDGFLGKHANEIKKWTLFCEFFLCVDRGI